jgi:hypothetical protein
LHTQRSPFADWFFICKPLSLAWTFRRGAETNSDVLQSEHGIRIQPASELVFPRLFEISKLDESTAQNPLRGVGICNISQFDTRRAIARDRSNMSQRERGFT